MNLIKTPSAKGRTHSEILNLKLHICFLALFGLFLIPYKVKLAKLPTFFAKQTQFQNDPLNTNPLITNAYKNQASQSNTKQTQFKANPNPNKAAERCIQRGAPHKQTQSNPIETQ